MMSEWMTVSKWIVFRTNKWLLSYIFSYQKNHPNIILIQLDAKAKSLATLTPEHHSCSTRCKSQTSCNFKQVACIDI